MRSPAFNPQCLSSRAPFLHSIHLKASTVPGSKLQTNQTVPDTAQNSTAGKQAQPGEVFQGHIGGHPVFTYAELGLEQPTCCLSPSAGSTQVNHHHVRINQPVLSQASLSGKNQHQSDLKPYGILSPKEAFCPGPLVCNGHIVFHLRSGHCILSVL